MRRMTTAERIAAEREREEDMNRRRQAEVTAERAEQDRRYVQDLAAGAETSRQRRAAEVLSYLNEVGRGRWAPMNEAAASHGTMYDNGRALRLVDEAARAAVGAALAPLVEQAEHEAAAADQERDEIIRRVTAEGSRG
jgi:hypothetical protein